MKHKISINELENFNNSVIIAGSFGKGEDKKITVESILNKEGYIVSFFNVWNQGSCVKTTASLKEAIEKYNEY